MVAVAQLVEPWIVIPAVVGSSPIGHPTQDPPVGKQVGFSLELAGSIRASLCHLLPDALELLRCQ